ncbi:MAG: hypothetical protein HC817_14325, partial [Saprospiraceae bacterium]|nr:hypothetical protein [Saprospiraceae bacterium]
MDCRWLRCFPDSSDQNFTELKNQCVENGFGLVIVGKGENVNLLITPAREEVFGKKRRQLKFMENPSVQSLKNYSKKNLERYRQPYFAQAMTCVLSALVLSGIFYRQWQNRPQHEVTQILSYQDSLARLSERLQPEAEMMVYKKEDVAEVVQNVQPYAETYLANELDQTAKPIEVGLYVYTPTDGYLSYDCARAGVRGVKFVVQDQLYRTFAEAQKRIEQLKTHGLIANAISLTCTESNINGYCVYFELMYNDERAANAKALQVQKDLSELRLPFDYIKIRTLKF